MDEKRDDLKSKKGKPSIVTAAANVAGVAGSVGHSPRIGSIEELLRGSGESGRTEKSSALHKAKKHLKTLMGGGAKREKSDSLRQMAVQGSEDRDSDSESTLVSASRSTSTLNSASDLEYDMRYAREREARREERRRIIAERLAIRSRANSISDESHSPTCPNPVLCRRYSRDIEAASSSIYGYGHSHGHLHQSHCWTYSHAVTSHLPIARSFDDETKVQKHSDFHDLFFFFLFWTGEAAKMAAEVSAWTALGEAVGTVCVKEQWEQLPE